MDHAKPSNKAIIWRRIVGLVAGIPILLAAPLLMFALSWPSSREARDAQRAMYPIEWVLTWTGLALAALAVAFAVLAPMRLTSRAYLGALVAYAACFAAAYLYSGYLRTFLDYGQGG